MVAINLGGSRGSLGVEKSLDEAEALEGAHTVYAQSAYA